MIMYKLLDEEDRSTENYLCELDELRILLDEKAVLAQDDKPWILYHNSDTYFLDLVTQKVSGFGWEQLLHPKHSPDISPTDYQIFQKFQFAFNTTLFTSFEEVEEFTFRYFSTRRAKFFQEALDILPEKWHRIIETEGEYIATNEKV